MLAKLTYISYSSSLLVFLLKLNNYSILFDGLEMQKVPKFSKAKGPIVAIIYRLLWN
jgi:hypothetical protein